MPKQSTATSNTIAFRAPENLLTAIEADCLRLKLTRGELVRAIVVSHYENQPAALRDDLEKLLTKVGMIHRNQVRSLVTLLNTLGKLPLDEAKQIVLAALLS